MASSKLAQCLTNEKKALSLLAMQGFYHNLPKEEATTLKAMLFSATQTPPEAVKLALAALLLLKFKEQLTQQELKQLAEDLAKGLRTSSFKSVVAALLIRIPHFTGFKHVIPHLEPSLVPEAVVAEAHTRLKESSAGLYEKQVAKHKREWCSLSASQELSFAALTSLYEQLKKDSAEWDFYDLSCRIESETNYLLEKISRLGSQRVDISKLCQDLELLVSAHPVNLQDVPQIHQQMYTELREKLRVAGLDILIALLSRLERRMLRRYAWLLLMHEFCFSNISSLGLLLRGLELTNRLLQVFGRGCLPLESVLFTGGSSLMQLLDFLFRRKQPSNQPKQEHHYRKEKLSTRQKTEKAALAFTTSENVFAEYLSAVNTMEEEQIVLKCLKIFHHYYSQPHGQQHTAALMELFDANESKLSRHVRASYELIRHLIFPKSVAFSKDVDQVYEELCEQRLQRRKHRNTLIQVQSISIVQQVPNPTRPALKESTLNIKKAASEDLELGEHTEIEGWSQSQRKPQWGSQAKKPQPKPEQQPSEMFYSFHDSRVSKQAVVVVPSDSAEFVLTPSFQ